MNPMTHHMTHPVQINSDGLITRYRNLLITLARDATVLRDEVSSMRAAASNGNVHPTKRRGMLTLINARTRQRARLLQLLGRNSAGLRHFFSTTNPDRVAEQEIKMSSDLDV